MDESNDITVLKGAPVVAPLASMALDERGLCEMRRWVAERRPGCVPEDSSWEALFPHPLTENGRLLRGNELLAEIAGRKCYDSFGAKAGQKTNRDYIANTQAMDPPHASILYHCKMTFFIGGVSRRVSHELIRHYVGADRDEEGSPSQESTRYVEHSGYYVAHPAIVDDEQELAQFAHDMRVNYRAYSAYIARRAAAYAMAHEGAEPKGMDRKRIFESASPYLSHSCETSFVWTTNPIALAKLIKERDNDAADLEFRRLAIKWKRIALAEWPNLFPQPWMRP